MLVCPHCRSENAEESTTCRHCGNALDASATPMRRVERPVGDDPALDLPPPRRQSVWPLLITALVAGLVLLGWGLSAALEPNPCEGKFSSALFAYCADIPEGWAGGLRPIGDTYEDRFVPQDPGQAQATVRVTTLADPTVATEQYVQQFRTSQEAQGLALGELEQVTLDGEAALAWGYTVEQEAASPLRYREVILVRPEGAWRIRLIATDEAYEEARFAFEELLASWRWKP